MPYDLPLPANLSGLWKVKIQDREALYEEPHITIWRRAQRWRYSLRRKCFLDPRPNSDDVPAALLQLIELQHEELCRQWDVRFPSNPVVGQEDDHGR